MTPTPTRGAADLLELIEAYAEARHRQGHSSYNAQTATALQAVKDALAAGQATASKAVVPTGFLHNVIALCTQRGYSPENIEAWSTDHKWIADLWRQAAQMLAAAPAQPATQQGAAYAEMPEPYCNAHDDADACYPDMFSEHQMHAFADATHTLRASHGQAPAQPDPAYSAACHLATVLFKKHFAHLPDYASGQVVWGLCDSTAGVISQIDNMVSGLVQPPTTTAQAAQQASAGVTLRSMIEGMSVSVDVSTGDHDAGHRYFGTVTEVMECQGDKHGVTLLVQDAEPNFTAAPTAPSTPSSTAQQASAHVLHLVQDAFAEVAMAYPKAFALYKVGLADTAVRKALAAYTPQAADTGAAQGASITAGMEPAATVRTLGVVGVKFSGWTDYGCSLPDGTKLYTEAQLQAQIAAACPHCRAAGTSPNTQQRCPDGALLWAQYNQAGDPPHFTWLRKRQRGRKP